MDFKKKSPQLQLSNQPDKQVKKKKEIENEQ